tara:strand:+ start:474 stop:1172 length:699 start_codon:yes stop_codon:yes gene_type:complete
MSEEVTNEPSEANEEVVQEAQEVDYRTKYEHERELRLEKERSLTKQGFEVGQLRKVVDDHLLSSKKEEEPPVDFFEDPDKAVDTKITSNPKIQELESKLTQIQQLESLNKLKAEHPDYVDIVKQKEFQDWVGKSKVRTRLLQEADQMYDYDSAHELLETWKERTGNLKNAEVKANQQVKTKNNLAKAKVHTGGANAGNKTYTRLELINMKNANPDLYNSLNVSELYKTGRVR